MLTKTLHSNASKTRHPPKNLAPHCKESLILVENTPQESAALRRDLDQMLPKMASAAASWPKPRIGWIRIIRWALWMSPSELARKLGVAQSTLTRLEESEMNGTISMQSLRRAANVLGCDVVYAFVPRQPLDVSVRAQALGIIERSWRMQQLTRMISQGRLTPKGARRTIEGHTQRMLREPKFWSK